MYIMSANPDVHLTWIKFKVGCMQLFITAYQGSLALAVVQLG